MPLIMLLTLFLSMLSACQSPAIKLQQQAMALGLERTLIASDTLPLISYQKIPQAHQTHLYIYLEGDGSPWEKGYWPASNPTTRQSVVLPLLGQSKHNGIYLSRPCYGWQQMPKICQHLFWTAGRYSKRVVNILSQGLTRIKQQYRNQHFVLVGHSGGGTLAMLLAARRTDIAAVVTLAANLDHRAWTQHFNYLPLSTSLNPATEKPLPAHIQRWHFIGGQDFIVPKAISQQAAQKDPHAKLIVYPHFDHHCCWQNIWQDSIGDIERALLLPGGE